MDTSYEKLGAFYLGREVDPATGNDRPEPLLYDSRDLTTHAVCVGMTGSGKTGLCISLLEEAAIDAVPAIVIDPKGDMSNLLLTFPQLRAEDFAPWVDAGEAARKGMTTDAFAAATAKTWQEGLSQWHEDGARIQRFKDAVDVAVYTPGNESGRPLSIMRSFAAPAPELRADAAALRERINATVAGLLGLVGVEADPIKSREHILLSTLLDEAWRAGRDLDLASLIQAIHKPPFDKVGVFDLETFYPAKERLQLAMSLNNLMAAPGFAAWMHGEPLDVQRLLHTEQGKPRIAIISIAHLNDAERMFVVTLLLGEVVAWMRRQSGTSSLRALLYMDEIFGYFPPSSMPPSKLPLLTLMKQARAFGLGVVLATQNPVDLDYKGLSNAGTWFIGRLQTQRDRARVVDGLLGAAGEGLDKAQIESLLAGLGNRVFLMRNVHDDATVLFRSRWALSYLRGPMTLAEIARLSPSAVSGAHAAATSAPPPQQGGPAEQASAPSQRPTDATKPVIPADINEVYLTPASPASGAAYTPHVLGMARLHFVDKPANVDVWETRSYLAPLDANGTDPDWGQSKVAGDLKSELSTQTPAAASYAPVPAPALRAQSYRSWAKQLQSHIYGSETFTAFRCAGIGANVVPGGSEGEFRARIALALREKRDAEIDELRKKYAPRLATLEDQLRRASSRVERERSQLSEQKLQTVISVGSSLLGALLGRKKLSSTNVGRIGSAARSAGRIGRESDDVTRAQDSHEVLEQRLTDLRNELEQEVGRLQRELDPATAQIEKVEVKARKSDIEVTTIALAWVA
jgi:Helicase HerA, central domain